MAIAAMVASGSMRTLAEKSRMTLMQMEQEPSQQDIAVSGAENHAA
ncbi:hypothetical protein [Ruegeria arenilitoris]|nr:hypothetical protein [Ruegeria arenilitoris]